MRRILLLALPLCVVACSKSKELANVPIDIEYTPSFKTGCIVMNAQDEANAENTVEPIRITGDDLRKKTPPLKLGVIYKEGWSTRVKVTITAHEQNCGGKEVDRAERVVDLSGNGRKALETLSLVTPDEDGDGYVAKNGDKGGTDCDDSGPDAAKMYPGNVEVCDDIDNNCVGGVDEGLPKETLYRDADGDGTGGPEAVQRCLPATGWSKQSGDCNDNNREIGPHAQEVCDEVDNNCVGGVDEGFDKNWYLDEDGDGAVSEASLKVQCQQPAGYIRRPPNLDFDCRDDQPFNTPGKQEICDDRDNNCINGVDEGFTGKGDSCTNQTCTGIKVCNSAGDGLECSAKPPKLFYPDADGDGDGNSSAAAAKVCEGQTIPQGHVENLHTDCDDADPATKPGAPELCDAIDNNCVGGADEGLTCNGTLKKVPDYHLTSADQDWKTVSMGANGYPVWIAGTGGKLAMKRGAGQKFESFSFGDPTQAPTDGSPPRHASNCGNHDWTVSWMDSGGRVFLGGSGGWIALHNGDPALTCGPGTTPPRVANTPSLDITGMVGFEVGGATHIYITDVGGRLILWTLGAPEMTVLSDPGAGAVELYGLHGLTENLLLAAGGTVGGTAGRLRAYTGGGTTVVPHTASANASSDFAMAVWMGAEDKACAVGEAGQAWRWGSGTTTWTRGVLPSGSDDFSSVVMRYDRANPSSSVNEQCYMVDTNSSKKLRRWTPFGWAKDVDLPSTANRAMRDLAMNPTGSEFWIVGDDGRVFHYPEP
ncbi:putative metal-binding motif-containing protein [Myxococcus stipitatus]|uniref:putative metal-binding motif-containing protein n=1 Tax=Myxococcus stipitatus TaxID=83455 RepID=UPI0030CE8558